MDINLHLTISQFALGVIATIAVIIVGKRLLKIIFIPKAETQSA